MALVLGVVGMAEPTTANAAPKGARKKPPPPPPPVATQDLARAKALDREGAKAYGEGRYQDAIRAFEEAHRLGGPPFELWNVAKCYLRLDQPDQAADMLERYLATPNLPKDDREEATKQLEALKKRPSTLTVSSSPSGADVTVDGKDVGRTPVSISIPPGTHSVSVTSESGSPYTRQVEAKYGRAVVVDAGLPSGESRPPPPDNPYDQSNNDAKFSVRASIGIMIPRHGSIGGRVGAGLNLFGTYHVADLGKLRVGVGPLLAFAFDSWDNRTGVVNEAPGCAPISNAQSATALSFYALGTGSYALAPKVRLTWLAGLGLAGYLVDNLGGDLFVPTCNPSPGLRPTFMLGAEIDYLVTNVLRVSAFPLTWQIQSGFSGTREDPRDASGAWMRFGIGIGAGADF